MPPPNATAHEAATAALETGDRDIPHPTPIQGDWTIDAVGLPPEVLQERRRAELRLHILVSAGLFPTPEKCPSWRMPGNLLPRELCPGEPGTTWSMSLLPWNGAGKFPKQIKLSERSAGWLESEVNDWLTDRIAERDRA